MEVRRCLVVAHRWAGLAMALFLIVAGITGSLLAFYFELDRFFAPNLYASSPAGRAPLPLWRIAELAQARETRASVTMVSAVLPDQVAVWYTPRSDPVTKRPFDLGFDECFVDPSTGAELGRRRSGDLSQGLVNLMPFVYRVHWTLALGDVGKWILGIAALVWTLDCFTGLCVSLPRRLWGGWRRWWSTAWRIKWRASAIRLNFDIHRAASLWLLPLLFVFGWSSVMMNVRPVFDWVMLSLSDYRPSSDPLAATTSARDHPAIRWRQAQEQGRRLVAIESERRGFTYGDTLGLAYFPASGQYMYEVRGSRDIFERAPKGGNTYVMFDGDAGALTEVGEPTGTHVGNTIESWLYALHMARVFGMPYRILVCALGAAVATICGTGVYIWLRKRRAARKHVQERLPTTV